MKQTWKKLEFWKTWIFEKWKPGKFWNLGKNGFLKNGKMEHFGILEKWIFEKWKNGKFWSVWYKMLPWLTMVSMVNHGIHG